MKREPVVISTRTEPRLFWEDMVLNVLKLKSDSELREMRDLFLEGSGHDFIMGIGVALGSYVGPVPAASADETKPTLYSACGVVCRNDSDDEPKPEPVQ